MLRRPGTAARRRRRPTRPAASSQRTRIGWSWPRAFRLAARSARASGSNSFRGWSGSGTIRSSSIARASLSRAAPWYFAAPPWSTPPGSGSGPPAGAAAHRLRHVARRGAAQVVGGLHATLLSARGQRCGLDPRRAARRRPPWRRLRRGRLRLVVADRLAARDRLLEVLGQRERRGEDVGRRTSRGASPRRPGGSPSRLSNIVTR